MICPKCGAIVIGRFCSCCGEKMRTSLEAFRLAERGAKRAFEKQHKINASSRLAEACWFASYERYAKYIRMLNIYIDVPEMAYIELQNIVAHAEILFNSLVNSGF